MKIESYDISASAQRSYQKTEQQSVSGRLWSGGASVALEQSTGAVTMSLSEYAQQMLEKGQQEQADTLSKSSAQATTGVSGGMRLPQSKEELKLQMLESFLSAISGRRVNLSLRMFQFSSGGVQQSFLGQQLAAGRTGGSITATQFVSESVSYNAKGVVKTADGKEIDVDVHMRMSRDFASYAQTTLQWGAPQNAIDPLVINYGGAAASLTGQKYDFDLDADGVLDKISFAGPGSGFLALDKNGDGTINDGSELFGPNTGNGFGELRGYDKDGNGWIDENDAVFDKLRIWSKDENGKDQLFTLRELDIGAIYLGDVETEFSMTDAQNNAQGIMRSTSFFLKESGGAGTINHIDLVV